MDTAEAGPAVPSHRLCPCNLWASRGVGGYVGDSSPDSGRPPARPQTFGGFSSGSGQTRATVSHAHPGPVWTRDLPSPGSVPEAADHEGTPVDLLQSPQ